MTETISTGKSGEYFVAGELERRGFTVALTTSNTKDFDILAICRNDNDKRYAIQVKTSRLNNKKWIIGKKSETLVGSNIIYVFVALNGTGYPEYHIVDSATVAKQVKDNHEKWLKTPGKKGQKHNDNSVRNFYDLDNKYKDNWGIL